MHPGSLFSFQAIRVSGKFIMGFDVVETEEGKWYLFIIYSEQNSTVY
jgi:hypothetical protein